MYGVTGMQAELGVSSGGGGSNFASDWDMSIGEPGGRADELTIATLSTLTGTTITPDYPLSVTGDYLFTGGETGRIQLADPGPDYALFALTMPAGACTGVQIRYLVSVLCNSGADAGDIEAIFNGNAPSTAVWAVGVMYDISAWPRPQVKTFAVVNSVLDLSNPFVGASFNYGEVWPFTYIYETATLTDYSVESISVVLDTAAITGAGQQLKIIAGGLAESGRTQYGYGSITYAQNGFMLTADAYLPDGATDGNWYRVTGAGTFAGVDTVIGDYVKLIEGMTDIIAVHYGSDGAQGPQGDPGADGAPGADGDPGDPGADGLSAYVIAVNDGFVGDEAAWLASLVGPQGDPGADGEPGADGAQGDPGPAGIDGADGDPGAPGADGLSAYEVAVANGFIGNEAAWLASLVGATGPTGATGPQGPTGATGATGTAATIAVGTVTTGAAGSAASITNVGTSSAAIFNFTIPRGDTGSSGSGTITLNSITGAYLVYAADRGTIINCTANTFTVSLTAASTLGAGFHCWVWNTSNTSSHVITIDPNSTETIDGATTLLLRRGEGCQIVCDGSNWQTGGLKKYRLYSENAANNATRPVASGGNGVAIGNASIASGSNGVAIGNASQATTTSTVAIGDAAAASGASAVALGTARAATADSVAIAITDSTSTYGAKTNSNAVAMGQLNIASGAGSVVIGGILNGSAASYAAVIGGDNAQMSISASNSAIVGGTLANSSAGYGVILGGNALIQNVKGKVVSGTGSYSRISNGEAQTGTTTLMGVTTSATPVVLTADKSSASTSNQLLLTDKQSMVFRGKVVAKRKGSESATSSAGWEFSGVIRRGADAASTALVAAVTPTLIAADTDAAAWTIAVTADTTNGALAVTVTGEASKSILWVCTLHSTEALYN